MSNSSFKGSFLYSDSFLIFKTYCYIICCCFEYHTIRFATCGELDIDFYFVLQYNKKRNFKGD